jgi:hypothetical protein
MKLFNAPLFFYALKKIQKSKTKPFGGGYKNVIGGSSDPPHPGRSEDLPGTIFIDMRNEAISGRGYRYVAERLPRRSVAQAPELLAMTIQDVYLRMTIFCAL